MTALNIEANLARPDDFYELLIDTHRDMTREESELVNCKLILLLANHVGDLDVLRDAMTRAREGVARTEPQPRS
ncbi:MAG: DUF2783 domain-containing protein [Burkholderiaceae bacterium]